MSDKDETTDQAKPHRRGCIKRFSSLRAVLSADLYRYSGSVSISAFLKHYVFTPGYKYTVLMRTCGYLRNKRFLALGLYPISKALLLRCRHKYGIAIPEYTVIAPGLFINRFGGIYVGGDAIIGSNVNVTHGVLLGYTNRGPRRGCPEVGARTFLGSGAKIIGRISIGTDCSIGANAVVTKDLPNFSVAGGVPAKLLSTAGSEGYINRQVPETMMRRCVDAFVGPVPDNFV